MNFLPIATRELTVAARRKSTYHIRLWSAVAAILVAATLLIFFEIDSKMISGSTVFLILSSYALGLCLLAGSFLTADCLSEEKREGTLGLLFLTDLKGYDVVLGKMLATSLNAFYALFALFPVLALPLLLGGVTAGEFWRKMLALLNALFFSLALGIWISARSRESEKVLRNAFAWLIFFAGVLPLLEFAGRRAGLSGWWLGFTLPNPFSPFRYADEMTYIGAAQNFWITVVASQLLSWAFIFRASMVLPRSWQDRETKSLSPAPSLGTVENKRADRRRDSVRRKLLEQNPVLWLTGYNPRLSIVIWILTIISLVSLTVPIVAGRMTGLFMMPWFLWGLSPVPFFIKIIIAMRAPAFFVEARRSGALELLLSTPLTGREIIDGQWDGLKRLILLPSVLLVLGMIVPAFLTLLSSASGGRSLSFVMLSYGALKFILSISAIGWFGMWMGLTVKRTSYARGLTVLFAVILPMMAFCVPDIAIYIFLSYWAKSKLEQDLRPHLIATPSA